MTDCLFCKIAAGEIPCKKVYEDEDMLAFYDIAPQAPVHILVIPKMHIPSLNGVCTSCADVVGKILVQIPKIASQQKLLGGYRLVSNCGDDACQSVQHLHFHILGGTKLSDKMA